MSDMTIAQALRRIKKLKGQIAESQQRATAGVSYDQTNVPVFRYRESVDTMFTVQDEMVALESRVAIANATNSVITPDDKSITLALAVRTLQEYKGRIAFLKGLHLRNETIKERTNDWDDNEMKHIARVTETTFISDLSEQDRDKEIKSLQNRFEALNNSVENANHILVV